MSCEWLILQGFGPAYFGIFILLHPENRGSAFLRNADNNVTDAHSPPRKYGLYCLGPCKCTWEQVSVRYVNVRCYSPISPSDRVEGEGECEAMVEGYWEGKLKDLENNISQCELAYHKTAYSSPESKSGLRGVRPATTSWTTARPSIFVSVSCLLTQYFY